MDLYEITKILSEFSIEPSLQHSIIQRCIEISTSQKETPPTIDKTQTLATSIQNPEEQPSVQNNKKKIAIAETIYSQTVDSKYEELGVLGAGGMGEVRRVRDLSLNRSVAMKVMHAVFTHEEQDKIRFVEEAQICAQLQPPNIIPIYEIVFLLDGFYAVEMILHKILSPAKISGSKTLLSRNFLSPMPNILFF